MADEDPFANMDEEETVCKVCGVSYLVFREMKALEKKIKTLEAELKEKQTSIEAANTALELNQRAKSDADAIIDKVSKKCDMKVAAMEAECEAKLRKAHAEHEKHTRELLESMEAKGRAQLRVQGKLAEGLQEMHQQVKALRTAHRDVVERQSESTVFRKSIDETVAAVTSACQKQQQELAKHQGRADILEQNLTQAQEQVRQVDGDRLALLEQLRGERELVDEWKGHAEKRAEEAAKWEEMATVANAKITEVASERDCLQKQLEGTALELKSALAATEQNRIKLAGMHEENEQLKQSNQQHVLTGEELQKRVEDLERSQKDLENTSTQQQHQKQSEYAAELSKRTGESARLRKECTTLSKQVEEGKRLIIAMRDEHKEQEAQLLQGLESANAATAAARAEAAQRGQDAAARSITIEKLHAQLNQMQETSKQSAEGLATKLSQLKLELTEKDGRLTESQERVSSLSEELQKVSSQHKETQQRWQDVQDELHEVKSRSSDLSMQVQEQSRELSSLRQSAKDTSGLEAEAQRWRGQLENMDNLMLKLSDNIRNKELQVKQLQDTVHAQCEERRELQQIVDALRAKQQSRENTGAKSSTPINRGNQLSLPKIDNAKRGRMQSG